MRAVVQVFWAASAAGPTAHTTNMSACQGERHDKMANLVGSRLVPLLGECLRWPITSSSTPSLHINNTRSGVNNLIVATPELVLARREVLGVLQAIFSGGGSGSTHTSAAIESFMDCHATDKQYSRALLAPLIAQFWLRAPDADELQQQQQQQRASGVLSSSSSSLEGALALYQAQAAHLLRVLLVASGASFLTALTVPQLRRHMLLSTSPVTTNAAGRGHGRDSGSAAAAAAAVSPSGGHALTTAAATTAAAAVGSGDTSTSGTGPASACNGAGEAVVTGGVSMQMEEEEEEEEGEGEGDAVSSRLTKHAALSTLVLAWSKSVRVLDSAPPLLQAEEGGSGTFFAHFVCASELSRLLNAMATALSASTDNDDGNNNQDTGDVENQHHYHHNSNSMSSRLSEMGGALVQRAHHTLARWDTGHTHPSLQPLGDDLLELQMLVVNYL